MKTHRLRLLVSALWLTPLVLTLAGCGGGHAVRDQGQARTVTHTGLALEPGAADRLGYVPNWATSLALDANQHVRSVHLVANQGLAIIIEEPTNLASAVSLSDGSIRWRRVFGARGTKLFGGLGVGDDRLFFNTQTRTFLVDSKSGDIQTVGKLESTVISAPVIVDDDAVFGARNGRVFAQDIDAGFPSWSYQISGPIVVSPVVSGQSVFAADSQGTYAALGDIDGNIRWRNHTWGPVIGQPAAGKQVFYVPSLDRSLYALDAVTGEDQWIYRLQTPLRTGPTALGNYVFQPVPGDGLHAIHAKNGERQWKFPSQATAVTIADNQVLLKTGRAGLVLADLESGKLRTQVRTRPLQSVQVGPDHSLILVTPKGRLLRLNPKH